MGGLSPYLFCNVTNQGFIEDNFDSVAEGILAIHQSHDGTQT